MGGQNGRGASEVLPLQKGLKRFSSPEGGGGHKQFWGFFFYLFFLFSNRKHITASKPRLYVAGLPVCQPHLFKKRLKSNSNTLRTS